MRVSRFLLILVLIVLAGLAAIKVSNYLWERKAILSERPVNRDSYDEHLHDDQGVWKGICSFFKQLPARYYLYRASRCYQRGEYRGAVVWYEKVAARYNENDLAIQAKEEITRCTHEIEAIDLYDRALAIEKEGKRYAAIIAMRNLIIRYPDTITASTAESHIVALEEVDRKAPKIYRGFLSLSNLLGQKTADIVLDVHISQYFWGKKRESHPGVKKIVVSIRNHQAGKALNALAYFPVLRYQDLSKGDYFHGGILSQWISDFCGDAKNGEMDDVSRFIVYPGETKTFHLTYDKYARRDWFGAGIDKSHFCEELLSPTGKADVVINLKPQGGVYTIPIQRIE